MNMDSRLGNLSFPGVRPNQLSAPIGYRSYTPLTEAELEDASKEMEALMEMGRLLRATDGLSLQGIELKALLEVGDKLEEAANRSKRSTSVKAEALQKAAWLRAKAEALRAYLEC